MRRTILSRRIGSITCDCRDGAGRCCQTTRMQDKQATQFQLTPKGKVQDAPRLLKLLKSGLDVLINGYVYYYTSGQSHDRVLMNQWFSGEESLRTQPRWITMGETVRKGSTRTRMGGSNHLGMPVCASSARPIPLRVRGRRQKCHGKIVIWNPMSKLHWKNPRRFLITVLGN